MYRAFPALAASLSAILLMPGLGGLMAPPLLVAASDDVPLSSWHAALERACAGQGQARIAFFGDSHVASDGLSGAVRDRLQARCGDAGPGFVLPVAPTPFYAPRRVGLSAEGPWRRLRADPRHPTPGAYGLGGALVEPTTARSSARVVTPVIDRIELWALTDPRGGTIDVQFDQRAPWAVSTRAPTRRTSFTAASLPSDEHAVVLRGRGDGVVRLFGLTIDRSGPGVVVDALGLDGARASLLQFSSSDVLEEQLRHRRHDLIVLAYGTNEIVSGRPPAAELEVELAAVVAKMRRLAPQASCLLVGPTDVPFAPRARRSAVQRAQQHVAAAAGCAFFDTVAAQGGPGANTRWAAATPPLALGDLVHLTTAGYDRVGAALTTLLASTEAP